MTVMDILEFRDMNGPAPMPKSGVMRSNKVRWAILPPPPFLGLRLCPAKCDSLAKVNKLTLAWIS